MHMNSAPHLRLEDRPEFERALDEALRTAPDRPELKAVGKRLNTEQLRTMALSASAAIAACAATEYQHFVRLREELRQPAHAPSTMSPPDSGTRGGGGGVGLGLGGGMGETGGAGLFAIISVLAPVLAGTAAAIFLIVGYVLHMVTPEPSIAAPMRNVGWVFAALAAASILIASVGLLLTAVRNGSNSIQAGPGNGQGQLADEVALARSAWRQALLERGIRPFLREALADPDGSPASPSSYVPIPRENQPGRTPRLGYSHPGFSSPADDGPEQTSTRPRFSSPDFSSPDYGGPDHKPE
ncbi:hypothetical protein [Streptomyces gobiensis]|uniref:hypothetical protein n=1 Tax=Streptomyces gobiensis TaxID=2875706 RepID=UPI001E392674|nr:hypothetical protein [Streptomyces gobiensis]UGY92516.1 hypothetical protein test1122_12830 [Streptomyces gobiensis]